MEIKRLRDLKKSLKRAESVCYFSAGGVFYLVADLYRLPFRKQGQER